MGLEQLMDAPELAELILHGKEERNLEYKTSMHWSSPQTRAKVAKSVIAMSNIPDGGVIVFGVDQTGETFEANGMNDGDFNSFTQDIVMEHVNGYADPYVEITVSPVELAGGKKFVVIQVQEFSEFPVVCKKAGQEGLRRGAIYTRSRRKYETAEVGSQSEMREILILAVDKEILRLRRRGLLVGGVNIEAIDKDRLAFAEQLGGL